MVGITPADFLTRARMVLAQCVPRLGRPVALRHRGAIRSGEESVLRSTALLRKGFISADFRCQ